MLRENLRRHWVIVATLAFVCGLVGGVYPGYHLATSFAWVSAVELDRRLGDDAIRQYKSVENSTMRANVTWGRLFLEAVAQLDPKD